MSNGSDSEDFNPSEITQEKDLWDVWLGSRKIPNGRLTRRFIKPLFFGILIWLSIYTIFTPKPVYILASEVRSLAELGFNYSATILGFLIAGFTIFATINKPSFFMELAKRKHSQSGLSYLKYTFFSFMRVFIQYLSFATYCLLIKILAGPLGPLSFANSNLKCNRC